MQNPINYQERVELARLANHIIDDSELVWGTSKPITSDDEADVKKLKENLETMKEDLLRLREIKLDFHPHSMNQKIKKEISRINEQRYRHFESAVAIPQRLLKILDKINNRGNINIGRLGRFIFREYEPDATIVFFDYGRGVMAMDDGAMAIKKAGMVREGQYTVDELNEHSRQTTLNMHGYLTRRERIPDKSPQQIADYVWSALNIMQPLEQIDDETVLYHRIAIGHPEAWSEMNKRRPDGIRYINSVKSSHTVGMGGHEMHLQQLDDGRWYVDLCFPELLAILTSPYIVELLIKNKAKGSVTPTYIA